MDIPPVPMVFTKHTSCISGPTANIEMRSDYVDYEAELVAVIGKPGKDIARDDAWQHVAGLCVGQDISDRPMQFSAAPPQFNLGKSFDTFGPIGPVLTSLDSLDDYHSMEIQCDVSGELRQKDNVDDLIFDIPFIISYLSEIVTLNTGDVIFTGTPAGVGVIDGKYLRDGEILTTSIAGLGTLRNRCVRVADHSRAAIVPDAFSKLLAAAREKAGAQK
jgi:2-keto-4-pentenoate hydratase/2-oxohepta-3-ene-1,7-dioic acid hydratase in catechol pathway